MDRNDDAITSVDSDVPPCVRIAEWRKDFYAIGENQLVRIWRYGDTKPIIGIFKRLRGDTILLEDDTYKNTSKLRLIPLSQIKKVQKITQNMILRFVRTTFSNRKKPKAIVEELRRQLSEVYVERQIEKSK